MITETRSSLVFRSRHSCSFTARAPWTAFAGRVDRRERHGRLPCKGRCGRRMCFRMRTERIYAPSVQHAPVSSGQSRRRVFPRVKMRQTVRKPSCVCVVRPSSQSGWRSCVKECMACALSSHSQVHRPTLDEMASTIIMGDRVIRMLMSAFSLYIMRTRPSSATPVYAVV